MNTFAHSRAALIEFDASVATRNAAWDCASSGADIESAQMHDHAAADKVRAAFYQDTKHINRPEYCMRIDIAFIRQCATKETDELKTAS